MAPSCASLWKLSRHSRCQDGNCLLHARTQHCKDNFFCQQKISLRKELIWQEIYALEGFLKAFTMIKYKLVGSQGFYFDLGVHLRTGDCQVNKVHFNTNLVVQVVMYLYLLYLHTYLNICDLFQEGRKWSDATLTNFL